MFIKEVFCSNVTFRFEYKNWQKYQTTILHTYSTSTFNFILPKVNTDYMRQAQVLNIDNYGLKPYWGHIIINRLFFILLRSASNHNSPTDTYVTLVTSRWCTSSRQFSVFYFHPEDGRRKINKRRKPRASTLCTPFFEMLKWLLYMSLCHVMFYDVK